MCAVRGTEDEKGTFGPDQNVGESGVSDEERDTRFAQVNEWMYSALHEGRGDDACGLTTVLVTEGYNYEVIVLDILLPNYNRLIKECEVGKVTQAHRHRAEVIVIECLITAKNKAKRRSDIQRSCCVLCVEGDQNWIEAMAISHMLFLDGWEVDFLTANVPVASISGIVHSGTYSVVVVSASRHKHISSLRETLGALRGVGSDTRVMMIGRASRALAEDPVATDYKYAEGPRAVREACEQILENEGVIGRLDETLAILATNLNSLLSSAGLTVEEFALSTDLDYDLIKGVSMGKVNVSASTVSTIAATLGVTVSSLFE